MKKDMFENRLFIRDSKFEDFKDAFPKEGSFYFTTDIERIKEMKQIVKLTEHCIKNHRTIYESQLKINYLIEDEKTTFDGCYLHTACQHINLETVNFLLGKGIDLNEILAGAFPLHVAVIGYSSIPEFLGERMVEELKRNAIIIIEKLLRAGANFDFSKLFLSNSDIANEVKQMFIQKNVLDILEQNEPYFNEQQRKSWHDIRMYKIL